MESNFIICSPIKSITTTQKGIRTMKKAMKLITGIALAATMAFSGTAGFAGTADMHDSCGCLTAHAYAHSCGQFVYSSTGWKYLGSGSKLGSYHWAIYQKYHCKRCRNCGKVTSWQSAVTPAQYVFDCYINA